MILEENTILVPEYFEEEFLKKVKKLQRKSSKISSSNLEVYCIGEKTETDEDIVKVYKEYEIVGESPKINGFNLLAKVERLSNNLNIVSNFGDIEVPNKFHNVSMYCEHCNSNRNRKYVFILQNEETGEFIQVGKSCLKDFTGHPNPEDIADYYMMWEEVLKEIEESGEDEKWSSVGSNYFRYDILSVLTYSAYFTLTEGYLPTTTEGVSTKDRVIKKLRKDKLMSNEDIDWDKYRDVADEVYNWMLTKEDSNNSYLRNLYVLAKSDYLKYNHLGFVVSAVNAKIKEESKMEDKTNDSKDKEEIKESNYVGQEGEKIEIKLIYKNSFSFDTMYGINYIHQFKDEEGNVFVWKTSKFLENEVEDVIELRGRIKEHSEYRGIKQTVLTRCKIKD